MDVEFLLDGANELGSANRSEDLPKDPMVEERPLAPSRGGTNLSVGVEAPEFVDSMDCLLMTAGPGEPSGAFVKAVAEMFGESNGVCRLLRLLSHLIA